MKTQLQKLFSFTILFLFEDVKENMACEDINQKGSGEFQDDVPQRQAILSGWVLILVKEYFIILFLNKDSSI